MDDIGAAERLAGAEVTIPEDERFRVEEDEYYLSDLIGCRAVDDASGRIIGTVTGWSETGGPGLLELDGGRVLVPFARSLLKKVDVAAREIRMELPEGLEELNG